MGKNVTISTLPNIGQNYLPKINTSSIFANSLVYDNGSSVLINTTTASAFRLDVNGSIRATSGTLTGALSGTTATFSDNSVIGSSSVTWYTGYTALNIGYSGAIWSNKTSSDTNTTMVGNNAYLNSGATNWIYQNNGFATRYTQVSGEHQFYSAASGTAGNAITWGTAKLTIASTGAATFSSSVLINGTFEAGRTGGAVTRGDLSVDTTSTASKVIIGRLSSTGSDNTTLVGQNRVGVQGWSIDSFGVASFGSTLAVTGAATFSSSVTAGSTISTGTVSIGTDGTYGANYRTLGLTGTTNGTHRIFAGTADNLYIAAASGRDIVFWTDGSSGTKASISTTGLATFSSSVLTNSPSEGATGEGLIAGRSFKIDATGSGQSAKMYVVSNTLSDTYGSALVAQYANFAGDKAFGFNLNTSGGFETYIKNSSGSFVRAMTITSGGYSKHSNDGTYYGSTGTYHEFRSTATSSDALVITATDASYTATSVVSRITRAAGTAFNHFYALSNGVGQFYVRGDGTIFAQNTTVQSASDIRMKENIFNSNDGLNIISALRPVRFDFKEGFGNDRKNQLGFIAQEVEAIFPDIIDIWGESDEKDNPYKSVGATGLIPVLVKAIQELKAEIDSLKN